MLAKEFYQEIADEIKAVAFLRRHGLLESCRGLVVMRLSLERSRVLIPVKVIGGRQEGHPVQKMLTAPAKSQLTIGHRPSPMKTGSIVT